MRKKYDLKIVNSWKVVRTTLRVKQGEKNNKIRAENMRSALFWYIAQRMVVIPRRFKTSLIVKGQEIQKEITKKREK
jgi:hypothetical protein